MADKIPDSVQNAAEHCEEHLLQMEMLFKPHCRLTLLMRDPTNDEGDLLLSTDSLEEIAKAIERAKSRSVQGGGMYG